MRWSKKPLQPTETSCVTSGHRIDVGLQEDWSTVENHLTQGSREDVRQSQNNLLFSHQFHSRRYVLHVGSPTTTIPHAVRKAFSLATGRMFLTISALFASEDTALICSPRSRTISCVFTAKALTLTLSQSSTSSDHTRCHRVTTKSCFHSELEVFQCCSHAISPPPSRTSRGTLPCRCFSPRNSVFERVMLAGIRPRARGRCSSPVIVEIAHQFHHSEL